MTTATPRSIGRTGLAIRCYVNPGIENMGLEQYGLSLFDGVSQIEPLGFIEKNGIKRYLTGLNENAPEVLAIPAGPERDAVIKDIRETASKVHKMITGGDPIDPSLKNKEFWKECKLLAPTNEEFWGKDIPYPEGFTIELDSSGKYLDLSNHMDILLERAIRAGGYKCLIAPSLEDAAKQPTPPKFYLDKLEATAVTNTELRKTVNKAKAELDRLRDTDVEKLRLIAISFDPDCTQYKTSTPADVIYFNLDRGIDGELWEKNKRQAALTFIGLCNLSLEDIKIKATLKIAKTFRFVDQKPDGFIYFLDEQAVMGRTMEDAFVFLKNPIHNEILDKLQKKVDREMNQ